MRIGRLKKLGATFGALTLAGGCSGPARPTPAVPITPGQSVMQPLGRLDALAGSLPHAHRSDQPVPWMYQRRGRRYEATGFRSQAQMTVSHADYRDPCPLYTVLILKSISSSISRSSAGATLASPPEPAICCPVRRPPLDHFGHGLRDIDGCDGAVGGRCADELPDGLRHRKFGRAWRITLSDAAGRYLVCVPSSGRDRPGVLDAPARIDTSRSQSRPGCAPPNGSISSFAAKRCDKNVMTSKASRGLLCSTGLLVVGLLACDDRRPGSPVAPLPPSQSDHHPYRNRWAGVRPAR